MGIKNTTSHYPFRYKIRFKFIEWKEGDATRGNRITRLWWKPFEWFGNRRCLNKTWVMQKWSRRHLTYTI